jgi:hypothetical protein
VVAEDVDWNPTQAEPLHLTPGEETQFAAACRVPADAAFQVNVIIRAGQHGEGVAGQWQASTVSLPRERNEEPASLAAGNAEPEDQTTAAATAHADGAGALPETLPYSRANLPHRAGRAVNCSHGGYAA